MGKLVEGISKCFWLCLKSYMLWKWIGIAYISVLPWSEHLGSVESSCWCQESEPPSSSQSFGQFQTIGGSLLKAKSRFGSYYAAGCFWKSYFIPKLYARSLEEWASGCHAGPLPLGKVTFWCCRWMESQVWIFWEPVIHYRCTPNVTHTLHTLIRNVLIRQWRLISS